MATTTLRLTAAVRPNGGSLPLFSGAIAMDGLQLEQIHVEPQIAAYRRMVRDLAFDVILRLEDTARPHTRRDCVGPHSELFTYQIPGFFDA